MFVFEFGAEIVGRFAGPGGLADQRETFGKPIFHIGRYFQFCVLAGPALIALAVEALVGPQPRGAGNDFGATGRKWPAAGASVRRDEYRSHHADKNHLAFPSCSPH